LFKGSLRFNLDPKDACSDKQVKDLLNRAGLTQLILKKKKEEAIKADAPSTFIDEDENDDTLLNFQIQSHGNNLSTGEKQLVCICRAILRENKIVILDEATANIDIVTEQAI